MNQNPDALIQRFVEYRPRLNDAAGDVEQVLKELLAGASIHATVSSRVKDVESFRGKVALRTDYVDPWAQITDKVGVRAIVHRTSHVDDIHRLIAEDGRLEIYDVTDKRGILDDNVLGYSGLHLDLYAPTRPGDTDRVPVELQIRTIAQHAWSEVSHKLLYKPQADLDPEDRRAIWRLVALVEVFDGEVARVMEKLPEGAPIDPGAVRLSAAAFYEIIAAQYSRFESYAGQRDLTGLVAPALLDALSDEDHAPYAAVTNAWVSEQLDSLKDLYSRFGPGSSMATVSDYVLWSQPESIAILEGLAHRPWALVAAWRRHSLPDAWLKPFEAVGTDIDLGLT
jgi:ppGpp synthetase/RelA/SpoT-type nucleotidyltranferase